MTAQSSAPQAANTPTRDGPAGVARTVAYALAVLDVDTVQRSTLRALLPKGERRLRGQAACARRLQGETISISKNKTSAALGNVLRHYEQAGWIERTPDLVHVRDRAALLDHALNGHQATPRQLLDLRGALAAIRADMRPSADSSSAALVEQRRREIRAVMELMQAPPGGDGTGSVRIIHKSQVI